MSAVKVALLGCGSIVQGIHIRNLVRQSEFEIVALAEPIRERREVVQAFAPRAVAVNDYREVLEVPGVEAVFVCLPTGMHAEAGVAALEFSTLQKN